MTHRDRETDVDEREQPLDAGLVDDAALADAVGLALLAVLDTLTPAERVAFVLYQAFGLAFDEIAPIIGHSPAGTRELASRAHGLVRGRGAG
jgi:RNA polymerase sigma-70 factor (ECF subfamily)